MSSDFCGWVRHVIDSCRVKAKVHQARAGLDMLKVGFSALFSEIVSTILTKMDSPSWPVLNKNISLFLAFHRCFFDELFAISSLWR
jgi:hypothetical protein